MTRLNASSAEHRIPNLWTVVVAAGGSSRFGSDKQKVRIGEKTVLELSVAAAESVGSVVIATKAEFVTEIEKTFSSNQNLSSNACPRSSKILLLNIVVIIPTL